MSFPASEFPSPMLLTKANLGRLALPPGKAEAIFLDDRLKGFGLRLREGGKRTWIAQYRLGTKQRRLSLGSADVLDPEEARRRAKVALGSVAQGQDPQNAKTEAKAKASLTFGAVVPRYLAYAEARQRANYHADVKRYLQRHWAPLAELPLDGIERATVAARLGKIAAECGGHSADRARANLSGFFGWAIGEGLVTVNPAAAVNRPVEPVSRDRVLSDAELALVWRLAGPGDFGPIVRLLILTGCRRDEVGGIGWPELVGDVWTIPGARAKNGRPHEVPLPPLALSVLTALPRRERRDLIFGSGRGGFSGWSRAKADLDVRMLAALREAAGPKAKPTPWRLHDIRRTAATRMADLGVQPHVVEAVLNHVSGSRAGVAGIYNRASYGPEKRAALVLWATHVERLAG